MAYCIDGAGLNKISELDQSGSSLGEDEDMEKDKKSSLSRIPRLTFSFRRSAGASQPDSTPSIPAPVSVESSPSSSPSVSRSTSLRLPRSHVPGRAHSSSSLHHRGEGESRCSQVRADDCHSNPGSRSNSPSLSRAVNSNTSHVSAGPEVHALSQDLSPDDSTSSAFVRRTKSFSTHQRYRSHTRSDGLLTGRGIGVGVRPSSSGRSKTPTGSSRVTAAFREASSTSTRSPASKSDSFDKPWCGSEASRPRSVSARHSNSQHSESSQRTKVTSRGKRPSSVHMVDGLLGANRLSQDVIDAFTPGMESSPSSRRRMTTPSRPSNGQRSLHTPTRTAVRSQSPVDRGNTPSPTQKSVLSVTSLPEEKQSSTTTPSRSQLLSSARLSRPSSARTWPSVNAAEANRPRSAVGGRREEKTGSRSGSRSSSPGSGRSTPVSSTSRHATVGRTSSSSRLRDSPHATRRSQQSPAPDTAGSVSTAAGSLPPRTPYRVARTRGASVTVGAGVGMNELEGSVLLEADDYRKIANDVKALKTMLLKMKREIQNDVSAFVLVCGCVYV